MENNSCEDGDVRLQNGTHSINGRVEVCQYGNWGSICADKWDNNDARVACRQLGYNFSEGDCLCVFQVCDVLLYIACDCSSFPLRCHC